MTERSTILERIDRMSDIRQSLLRKYEHAILDNDTQEIPSILDDLRDAERKLRDLRDELED